MGFQGDPRGSKTVTIHELIFNCIITMFSLKIYLGDSGNANKRIVCKTDGMAVKLTKIGHMSSEPMSPFKPKIWPRKIPKVTAN